MMMIIEKAYAKINLFLNVINKRFDGYHDLEMVMASVNLYDELSFKLNHSKTINIESNITITKKIEENIVFKIIKHLQTTYNIDQGVDVFIKKSIPISAGLAGGSADAAAALRGLNKLWKLDLSFDELAEIGLKYGSDIPFCIYNKLCIAKGRGEKLFFLDKKLNIPILLINPRIPVSTKEVFSKVLKEDLVERKISNMTNAIYNHNVPLIIRELHNSLEPIAFKMEPKIEQIKKQLLQWGAEGALMSGSGATVFAIGNKKILKQLSELFNDKYFVKLTKII
jgi:4-diphosphocytidyl-2-C-methyl-D-erythritol kinase